jgi:hypothetical protein
MEFLFLLGLGLFILFVVNPMMNTKTKKVDPCKLHKWVYDIQGFLFCSECKCRPGEISTEYDKPY